MTTGDTRRLGVSITEVYTGVGFSIEGAGSYCSEGSGNAGVSWSDDTGSKVSGGIELNMSLFPGSAIGRDDSGDGMMFAGVDGLDVINTSGVFDSMVGEINGGGLKDSN